jgi:hypothetical protein
MMSGDPNDRDQRLRGYMRGRADVGLPASLIDDVVHAAADTPQARNVGSPRWRTPLLAAAAVVLAIVVSLGALSIVDAPVGDDPTPSASRPPIPFEPSPTASSSPPASSNESAEPFPSPTATLAAVEPGDVLVSVTDNLVVRAEPGLDSQAYEVQLQPGDLLRVIDGPISVDGFDWYQGIVLDSGAPDGTRTGWVATADTDGTPWLASIPPEGDGWRLLGQATAGEASTVGVAISADELAGLWGDAGIQDPAPAIDFDHEVVVRYTHAVSGTCPEIGLVGIGVDRDAAVVYSVVVRPSSPLFEGRACTTDAHPHSFVVAVDRNRLPSGEVHFRLERGFIACPDCGREPEQVTVTPPLTSE